MFVKPGLRGYEWYLAPKISYSYNNHIPSLKLTLNLKCSNQHIVEYISTSKSFTFTYESKHHFEHTLCTIVEEFPQRMDEILEGFECISKLSTKELSYRRQRY